jgi:hypothetical protein
MSRLEQNSVHVYQNYFDEIIQDLQTLADCNREKNRTTFKNVYQNYMEDVMQDLHALAARNREVNHNSFNIESFLAKA